MINSVYHKYVSADHMVSTISQVFVEKIVGAI